MGPIARIRRRSFRRETNCQIKVLCDKNELKKWKFKKVEDFNSAIGFDVLLLTKWLRNKQKKPQPANQKPTCSGNMGEWMQLNSLRLSCRTRSLIDAVTTSMFFSWRSFTGSRLARPLGLASANRKSSCVAVEMAWPGGSSLKAREGRGEGEGG